MIRDDLLEAIDQAERGPSPGDLEGAPLLSNWFLHSRDGLTVAEGEVSGHPEIRDPWVTTSPVIGLDQKAGWMRTSSRWYRLAEPSGLGPQRAAATTAHLLELRDRLAAYRTADDPNVALW